LKEGEESETKRLSSRSKKSHKKPGIELSAEYSEPTEAVIDTYSELESKVESLGVQITNTCKQNEYTTTKIQKLVADVEQLKKQNKHFQTYGFILVGYCILTTCFLLWYSLFI